MVVMPFKQNIIGLICVLCLSACQSGFRGSHIDTRNEPPKRFINAINNTENQASSAHWWEQINDPLLNQYVAQLLTDNLSLKQAIERIVQAEETKNIAQGSLFPTLSGSADGSRNFSSSFLTNNRRLYTNNYNAALTSSWEIDLFGRIRHSVDSANNNFKATIYDEKALVHSLIAELLRLRVEIATRQKLLELSQETAKNRKTFYGIVENRYNLGTGATALSDVYLAENTYQSAQADTHEHERLLQDALYRLDILLGQLPGTSTPLQSFPLLVPPMDVPICIPAALIDRRPDLKSSALRLLASEADIQVAVADLYPTLTLSGSIGFGGNSTGNLFSADQLAGSILGSITSRLFEGGRLRANIRLQESEAKEQTYSYAETVLNAFREVETNLQAEQRLEEELAREIRSVDAIRLAESTAQTRYIRGIETLQNLLNIQQQRYQAEQGLFSAQQTKWNTRIALYLSLGGDWFTPNDHCEKGTETP